MEYIFYIKKMGNKKKKLKENQTIVKASGTFLSTFSLTGIIVDGAVEKSA